MSGDSAEGLGTGPAGTLKTLLVNYWFLRKLFFRLSLKALKLSIQIWKPDHGRP